MSTLTSFTANTIIQSSQVNTNFSNLDDSIRPTFIGTVVGTLTTDTSVTPALIVPKAMTITKAFAYVKTAPTGQALLLDINVGGTSIWNVDQNNRLTVAAAAQSGNQTIFDTTSLSEGDVITLDVDQVGSTVAGADLTVALRCSSD